MSNSEVYGELYGSSVVIQLRIENSHPIELGAFVRAFTAVGAEYHKVANSGAVPSDARIFVKQIREGSIIADLIPVAAATLPVIAEHAEKLATALEFIDKWRERLSKLASGIVPEGLTRSDLKTFAGAVEAIARDPNASSELSVATFEDDKRQIRAAFKFRSKEAVHIEKTIDAELKRLSAEENPIKSRVLMVFTRSDVNDAPKEKRSGEKVLIQEVYEKPLPIIYASELAERRIKHEIRDADDNIYKKGFNVDVSVLMRGQKPICYKVMNVYDIIDLGE